MAERHFVHHGKTEDSKFHIYFIHNEETGRNQYHLLEEFPEDIVNDPKLFARAQRFVERYNKEENKNAKIISLVDKKGQKHFFVDEPCMAVEAVFHIMQAQKDFRPVFSALGNMIQENKEIKDEQARREYIARQHEIQRKEFEGQEIVNGALADFKHYKKPSKIKEVTTRAVVTGMAVLMLLSSAGILARQVKGQMTDGLKPEVGITETYKPEETKNNIRPSVTTTPNTELEQDVPIVPLERPYYDYESLTYDTYTSSKGVEFIEIADALKIADACYSNIIKELTKYNDSVPDSQDYSFDHTKFLSSMIIGEMIRECSGRVYVKEGEDITQSPDYNDRCRGSFKIGPDAIKEANEVSRKLTGEDVIRTEEDLYDMVRACRACIYIAIKNYEYCAGVISAEDVNPNMVFDSYLWGCGNVRKWLRQCIEDGEYNGGYKPKDYSVQLLYYGDCLEEYWQKILAGKTDGSHDKEWEDLYYEGLWKVEEYMDSLKEAEPEA